MIIHPIERNSDDAGVMSAPSIWIVISSHHFSKTGTRVPYRNDTFKPGIGNVQDQSGTSSPS